MNSRTIVVRVNRPPVGQPRVTHSPIMRGGRPVVARQTGRPVLVAFVPKDHPVHGFRNALAVAAVQAIKQQNGGSLQIAFPVGPVAISIIAVFERPKALQRKTKIMHRQWKYTKPDCDNVQKAIMDSFNGLMWKDDAQVARTSFDKCVASGDEAPFVEVTVEALPIIYNQP